VTAPTGFAELTLQARDLAVLERFGLWMPGPKEFGDEGGAHVHYAFSAAPDSLQALARRLCEQGIGHRGPIEHEGGDRSLYLEDPEGNVVELWDHYARRRGQDPLRGDLRPRSDG
jgi:catechol-2,3-dioxygenase